MTLRFLLNTNEVQYFLNHSAKRGCVFHDYAAAGATQAKAGDHAALRMGSPSVTRNLVND
jgi:hypothetical protein